MRSFEILHELELSLTMIKDSFRVLLIKNKVTLDITDALSDYELNHLKLRYDVKAELEKIEMNPP